MFRSLGLDAVTICRPQTHNPDWDLRVEAIKPGAGRDAKPPVRVAWFLWGGEDVASSRLQGYLIHQWLERCAVASDIVFRPPGRLMVDVPWEWFLHWRVAKLVRPGVAVFQKLQGDRTRALIRHLKGAGTTTVYVDADYDPDNKTGQECDVVVCPSNALADVYRKTGAARVVVIPDPVEFWLPPSAAPRTTKNSALRIGWVGNAANWDTLAPAREVLREPEFADFQLVTISDHQRADVRWKRSLFPKVLRDFDVGLIPTGFDLAASVKSANRPAMFMAAGVPVIAGRIQAYEELIRPGIDGFMAQTHDEFRSALRLLRQPEVRQRVAAAAYEKARREFALDYVGQAWLELFTSLKPTSPSSGRLHRPPSAGDCRQARRALDGITFAVAFERAIHSRQLREAASSFLRAVPSIFSNAVSRARWLEILQRAPRFACRRVTRRALGGH